MPISNFKGGFRDGLTVRDATVAVSHPGKVFWVSNNTTVPAGVKTGSDGENGTFNAPFATLDYAVGRCSAGAGDIIFIKPGHVEAVTASSLTLDVAGIKIIGLGDGDERPKFNFGVTTSTITLSAANVTMKNVVLVATVDSVVALITLSGSGATLDLETRDTSAAIEAVSAVVASTAAGNLKARLTHRGFAAGDAMTRYMDIVGVTDADIEVDFFGIASTAVVNMRTTACNNIRVKGRFYNDSVALTKNVVNSTTSTWSVEGFDAKAARSFSGSDDLAVHYTDESELAAQVSQTLIPGLGYAVTKVSNLADGAGTDALFTVTGRCLITSLTGEVTTVIGGAATMKLTDTTNSVDLCAATTIDTDAVGTMYSLPGLSAQILNGTGGTPVVGSIPNIAGTAASARQFIGDAQAAVTISHILDAADTGAVTWVLTYVPVVVGSTIVAAA